MFLRHKTLLGMGIMLIVMIFAITGVSQLIVKDSYIELDEQQALKDAKWMQGLIESDMESLAMVNLDYALWDDSYEFIVSHDEEYVQSNLVAETFSVNRLDLIVYLDSSGGVVYGSSYDEINEEPKALSGSFLEVSSFSNVSEPSFINLPEGLLLISSFPIVKSNGDGPARGALVMGRFLDSDDMYSLSEGSGVAIELLPPNDSQLPLGIWNEGSSDVFIEIIDEDVLGGYYTIRDVFGIPAMVVKSTTPRLITKQGQDTLYYFALALLLVGLGFGFIMLFFLDKVVLRRISNLCVDVRSIGEDKDFFSRLHIGGDDELSRLHIGGDDELSRLSYSINSMLQKLEGMHKAAESALIQSKLEAEASSRTKSEFIANMSHELRTPLNSIIGFSDIIQSESHGSLNEPQKKYISNVFRNGKHLSSIIDDILSVSKIESGKMEIHMNEFFVSDAIDDVEILMIPLASEKDIELTCNIDIGMPTIKADMIKFKQILYNLVSNAIKFTDNGGTVTIGGKISEDLLHISVKDSGIGISPEDLDKLFEQFFQVDSSVTRKHGGIGLGLNIVKKFTEMHGGYVQVESKEGVGSTFTFSFPFDRSWYFPK